jgi:hypothetical protein
MVALNAGKQIQYVGAGRPVVFDSCRNSTAAFELVGYAIDGSSPQLDIISAADIARLST